MSGQAPVNDFKFLPKLTGDLGKGGKLFLG